MRRSDSAGMTLVEMLVVLAIIGVVSGVAILGMGSLGGRGGAEAEARTLGAKLKLAADEAMVTDRPIALAYDGHGYGFVDPGTPGDKPDPLPELGTRRDLRSGVRLVVEGADSPVRITVDGIGRAVAATLDDGTSRWTVRFDGIDVVTAPAADS